MSQAKKGIARKTHDKMPEGSVPASPHKRRAGGHSMPSDWREALSATPVAHALWQEITPLARNEWICWILDAKKRETRQRRIEVGLSKLTSGMRRPCCWAGCPHRSKER